MEEESDNRAGDVTPESAPKPEIPSNNTQTSKATRDNGGDSIVRDGTPKKTWGPHNNVIDFKSNPHCFSKKSKEEIRLIAQKGGRAPSTGKGKHYTKCIKCDIRYTCIRAFEESKNAREKGKNFPDDQSRCVYEIEGRQAIKEQNFFDHKAFVSANPIDLLTKIQVTFKKLEAIVDKDPSYTKTANLLYMMMNIYKLKFGEKAFIMNVNTNLNNNPSMDIKEIMHEIRKQDNMIIDAEPDNEGGGST